MKAKRHTITLLNLLGFILLSLLSYSAQGQEKQSGCVGRTLLNDAGGTTAANGLRIEITGAGNLQIKKTGLNQIYSSDLPNGTSQPYAVPGTEHGIVLHIGTSQFVTGTLGNNTPTQLTILSNTCQNDVGAVGGIQTDTIKLRAVKNGMNYDLTVIYTYTYPSFYLNIQYIVDIPAGNTEKVKVTHGFDTLLDGGDQGPGFLKGNDKYLTVGVTKAPSYEAFQYVSGTAWTSYYSAYYGDLNSQMTVFNNYSLSNLINADPTTDNGIAIQITFGASPGRYSNTSNLIFACEAGDVAPTVSQASINLSCAQANINLNSLVTSNAPIGTKIYWTDTSNVAVPDPTAAGAGNYLVMYKDTTSECTSPNTPVEVVSAGATISVSVNSASICAGQSATLTASGSDSYLWSDNSTSNTLTDSPTSSVTYTVIGTSQTCKDTAIGRIDVSQALIITVNSPTICSGESVVLTASGGANYTWTTANTNNSSITVSPNANTSYTVSSGAAGCSGEAIADITVTPIPTISVNSPTICLGETVSLTASGGSNYEWSSAEMTVSITKSPLISTTYTVTGETLGCKDTTEATITLLPSPPILVNSPTICSGESVTLTASGAINYEWSSAETTASITKSPLITTTYTLTGETLGCKDTIEATITLLSSPPILVNSPTICSGESVTLQASGATIYSWSDGVTTGSQLTISPISTTTYTVTGTTAGCPNTALATVSIIDKLTIGVNSSTVCAGATATLIASGATSYVWSNQSTENPLIVSASSPITYTVIGTDDTGCSDTATASITVTFPPNISVSNQSICYGETATLTASGASNYEWSSAETTASITKSPLITTTYTVTGETLGCKDTAEATVTLLPTPPVLVNSPTICSGESVILQGSGATNYSWSDGVTTGKQLTVSPISTTTFTVTGTTAGCPNTALATVSIIEALTIDVNTATVCAGSPATLIASGATSYVWSNQSTENPLIVSASSPITYTVIGTDDMGCKGEGYGSIFMNPLPPIEVKSDTVCEGTIANLSVTGGVSYIWDDGSTNDTLSTYTAVGISPFTVTGIGPNGCSISAIANAVVYKKPLAGFSANPNTANVFYPVITFNNSSSFDVNYWFWDFGDGEIMKGDELYPTHTYPGDTASYTATLIVKNAGGCADTTSNTVFIGPEFTFYMPSAFSPNNDKLNDDFGVSGNGVLEFQLLIFDRWGLQIFHTTDLNGRWKGDYMGEPCAPDTYVWKVFLKDIFKKEHSFLGTVTIVK